jgi:hypothetical protein
LDFNPKISTNFEPVHLAYNPSFSAGFFSQNSIFLSRQISQQCFSASLSAQPNRTGPLCFSEAFFLLEFHGFFMLLLVRLHQDIVVQCYYYFFPS